MRIRMNKVSKLLNNAEAAKFLGVSPDMLRLSRCTGELFKGVPAPRFFKLGAAIRYPQENLDNWLSDKLQFQNNAEVQITRSTGVA
jgi:predicted DNA-binding transcriptional regulator AlpA